MRTVTIIPEIAGCYGPRVWVSASDNEMNCLLRVLSVWGNFTDTRSRALDYQRCYELPFGFLSSDIWRNLVSRMNVEVLQD